MQFWAACDMMLTLSYFADFIMLYLLSASLIWAFSYGLIKSQLTSLDPNFVTVCRMFMALLVFLPFLMIQKNKKYVPRLLLFGAVQYGLMYLFVLRAYQYLDAYQVVLFSATTPFYVILFNTLFERRLHLYHFIVAGIAIMGGWIIYDVQSMYSGIFMGFCLVQASDICFAFGQVAYKKFRQNIPEIQDKEVYGFLFLGAFIISMMSTSWFEGWHSLYDVTFKQGLILVYLGGISSGLCFFWWNKGAVQMHPLMLSVFNNLKLPLATLVSLFFFHEQLKDTMCLKSGLLLILFALILAERYRRKTLTMIWSSATANVSHVT